MCVIFAKSWQSNRSVWKVLIVFPVKVVFGSLFIVVVLWLFDKQEKRKRLASRVIVFTPFLLMMHFLINGERVNARRAEANL
jgi:hypothetical protein